MYEFADSMSSCKTLEEVRLAFHTEALRHGYTSSACRASAPTDTGAKSHTWFRNWPKDWAELSDQKGFAENSFTVAESRRRLTSYTWYDAREARPFTAGEQEIWNAALARGWRNGFVLPVHGPGGYIANVSMASPERDLDLSPRRRMHLQMVTMLAHERCHALADLASIAKPVEALSPRELECLRWVAAGKTDWEIGMILTLSSATVKFHVDRGRAKLGSRTRAQAVARLVLLGLY